jgi:hypothetical protein
MTSSGASGYRMKSIIPIRFFEKRYKVAIQLIDVILRGT